MIRWPFRRTRTEADEPLLPAMTARQMLERALLEDWALRQKVLNADPLDGIQVTIDISLTAPAPLAREILEEILDREAVARVARKAST